MSCERMSLLERVSKELGCDYLSDIRSLVDEGRKILVQKLDLFSPEEVDLRDWNNVRGYLTNAWPERTAAAAKERLITLLQR